MKFGQLDNLDGLEFSLGRMSDSNKAFLAKFPSNKKHIYIGCPVWSDKNYVGKVYPEKTSAKNYLREYCKQFNSIEVNATRYGMKTRETWEQWKACAPEGFKFSFKFPDNIMIRKNLLDQSGSHINQLFEAIDYFGDRAGTPFMLVPHYMGNKRFDELIKFISSMPEEVKLAIEIRNLEMLNNSEFHDFLREEGHSLVITDSPGRRDVIHQTITNDTLFVRFAGGTLHPSDFTRIDEWCEVITNMLHEGLNTVYFYMHQPAPNKFMSANLASYMIPKLKKAFPNIELSIPKDYSKQDQGSLF